MFIINNIQSLFIFADTMSDRKAELEKKKAKLQAIREQKERLRKEKEKKDVCNVFNDIYPLIPFVKSCTQITKNKIILLSVPIIHILNFKLYYYN